MNRMIALALVGIALSGCVSTQSVSPRVDIIDRPAPLTVAKAEIGDTIVEKGKLSTYDGLLLKNDLTWGDGFLLKKFDIPSGRLRARQQDAKFVYYFSDKMTVYDAMLGTSMYPNGGICSAKADPKALKMFAAPGACSLNPKSGISAEPVRITDIDAPGFRQELIYNGRTGDSVKFLYREFSGDIARPPFSQDVQYDLKDGMMIGFKGVRIEIVEATNTSISYRVLSSFPDPVS